MRLKELVAGGQQKRGNFFQGGMSRAADPVRIRVGTEGHVLNEPVKFFEISVRKLVGHFSKIMTQKFNLVTNELWLHSSRLRAARLRGTLVWATFRVDCLPGSVRDIAVAVRERLNPRDRWVPGEVVGHEPV